MFKTKTSLALLLSTFASASAFTSAFASEVITFDTTSKEQLQKEYLQKEYLLKEQVKKALTWIHHNSDYSWDFQTYPKLEFLSSNYLQELYYDKPYEEVKDYNEILALYDSELDTIFLPENKSMYELQPLLVHELVHFLQDLAGLYEDETISCATEAPDNLALEPPAYEIHMNWMDAHNHSGEKPNKLFLFMLKQACNGYF